jgi:hypothetical protein
VRDESTLIIRDRDQRRVRERAEKCSHFRRIQASVQGREKWGRLALEQRKMAVTLVAVDNVKFAAATIDLLKH